MNQIYLNTARLLTQVAPIVLRNDAFALKGGTAINLFIRDMPRLSVDLDLVLPDHTLSREQALTRISDELRDSSARLRKLGFTVNVATAAQGAETKLLARRDNIEIKVEVNVVLRGVVGTVAHRTLARHAQDVLQAEVDVPVASLEDVYAGKLVAALDRQHPRDLFDVMLLDPERRIWNRRGWHQVSASAEPASDRACGVGVEAHAVAFDRANWIDIAFGHEERAALGLRVRRFDECRIEKREIRRKFGSLAQLCRTMQRHKPASVDSRSLQYRDCGSCERQTQSAGGRQKLRGYSMIRTRIGKMPVRLGAPSRISRSVPTTPTCVDRMAAWLEDDHRPLDWNGPVDRPFTCFPDQALDRPIIDHLEHAARSYPDRIAIRDADTALTFRELWDGLSGLAETLAADSDPEDLIGILLPASPLFPLAICACVAAGRPFVALDAHYPEDWLDQVLEDAQPSLIITGGDGFERVETRAPTMRVIRLTALPKPARACWRPAKLGVDEPACVLFTSGSTGRPKGIVNSQRNLLQRVAQSINAAHIDAEDRLLTLASPCTIVAVRDVMTALLAGASIRLLDPQRAGAREILNAIRAESITILFAFPALLRSVLAVGAGHAGPNLRLVRVGGDTTLWSDIDMLRAWLDPRAQIQLIYAATEAPMLQWFVDDSCRGEDARIPIGYPLPGNRLAIIDGDGGAALPGEVGELIVASPYVSLGRWVDGRCAPDSGENAGVSARRLFRTGDLVRQRPDGLLERVGRKDRQIKIRGVRVDLDGVEASLRNHPCVRDVAALARTSGVNGTVTLVAYVSPHDEAPDGLIEELKDSMRSVPPPMRPARFYLTGKIPRLPSSKLDVRALTALDDANVRRERAEPVDEADPIVRDRIAQTVARVWQDVLLAPVGGTHDDFFDAGGDSLKAITFAMELERALGLELSPTLIYDAPKFGAFCKVLRECRARRYALLVPLKQGAGHPPVFFIHGVGGNVVEILPMARRMAYPGAVIGIRARGLARGEVPHSSVEAMAADYLNEIKVRQPNGPYYLCGYSFGGLVAFEIARRLSESGNEVGFVGLFDTMMSPMRWPLRAWVSIVGRRCARLAGKLRAARLRTWSDELQKLGGRQRSKRGNASTSMQRDNTPLPALLSALPTRVIKVAASALIASARYRAGYYRGQLTLFTPVGREPGLPSLEGIWRKHARTLEIVETEGEHSTMLSAPNAHSAATALTRRLPVLLVRE